MQTRLSVEKYSIAISKMPLHSVANFELICDFNAIASVIERDFTHLAFRKSHLYEVRSWMLFRTSQDQLSQMLDIVSVNSLRVSQGFRHQYWHYNLIDRAVRIRRDDSTPSKVDTLA